MTESIHVLILEDSPTDAELVQYELQEAGLAFTSKVVGTENDYLRELREYDPDLILSDYDLPQYNGALALAEARKRCPDVPFILVTGAVGEDRAIEILTQGANDYVLKSRLQRLAPAVQRALAEADEHRARKAAEEELRESHRILQNLLEERSAALRKSGDRYRSLFENMLNGFAYCRMLFDHEHPQDFIYLDVNGAFESLTGLKNVVGKKVSEVIPGLRESDPELFEIYGRVALTGQPEKFEHYVEALKMWFSISVFSPEKEHFVAVFDAISERKLLEETQLFLLQHGYPDDDFFASLARYLAQRLGMDYACIDRLRGDRLTAQTLAVYFDGKFEDNVEYTLKDTPCGAVVGKTICCFPKNVRHLFPQDMILQEMVAESYVGTTLWSSKGQPIGLIALLSRQPLANPQLAEAMLKLVALRAAGELERQQVEEERYQSEQRYRLLHETMLQGVVYQDAEGNTTSMNPAAVRILGKGPEESLQHTSESAEHPTLYADGSVLPGLDHPSMVALRMGQELRDVVMGVYNPHEQGYRWINVRAVPLFSLGENKPSQVYIIFDDITERRKAERRESLATEVMGIINNSLNLTDTINRILTAIKRETGFAAVGIRLRSGNDFPYLGQNGFSPDFILKENSLVVRDPDGGICRDQKGNINLECTCGLVISGQTDPASPLFTPGGSFWINDSLPLLDLPADQDPRLHPRNRCIHEGFLSMALIPIRANQEIVGLLQINDRKKGYFTLDTITFFEELGASIGVALTRQRAEEAIKERTAQLEDANKELESFSYSVSHDLRAPLRAINGFSRMLTRDLKDKLDEGSLQRFDTIRSNALKMNQLIDDVLTFSRLSQESLTRTVISMKDLATDVWDELQENNFQRNISINVAQPRACYGDYQMMRRVLTNLLSNAAKFVGDKPAGRIEVGSQEKEDEYVYYVKDNGCGFDMQYSDKLFRLFQRLHSAADYEGTGAGLSIVKRIVERHGGRVWAEGKVNEGATFYFTLPK